MENYLISFDLGERETEDHKKIRENLESTLKTEIYDILTTTLFFESKLSLADISNKVFEGFDCKYRLIVCKVEAFKEKNLRTYISHLQ